MEVTFFPLLDVIEVASLIPFADISVDLLIQRAII
jgi:hypothetical protein